MFIVNICGACPECNIPLRRTNFRLQLFEDANVDKEVDIRRRILKDFNNSKDALELLDIISMEEKYLKQVKLEMKVLEEDQQMQQISRSADAADAGEVPGGD